jgi:maltose alpha-D-glucosyltransferase/alpha-amylase
MNELALHERPAALSAPAGFTDDPLWYKDAVIYQLHVKSFYDANNDGIGDFPGLIEKLDYIASLGVNTVWLLPFYPSPRRDDGYDIADYRGVHPNYGTMADVRRFIQRAHARGLRVITELVINHTSDQHPWFQRARKAKPNSTARNFYVWSDSDQKYDGTRIIFVDAEKTNWAWDPVAHAYYWHRFYSHQPDLNFDNPHVTKAVLGVLKFWLDMGVDGLRLDAVPYLVERDGTNSENLPETHAILRHIRRHVDARYPGRMLLAEANQWPEDTSQYFGNGDECHMAFHFPLMPRMYMALAQEDRFPITDILRQTPDIPANCQWAVFLRNHDELTLEMVTDKERDYLWEQYASDKRARLNLGIRRRLAPLMQGDRRRVELLNSLLLSMPGTPVLYYGDEIGMGDNIYLGDRDGVRTPMQWSPDRNGGFSRADPSSLVLPPIMDPLSGFQSINVEVQTRDPHSMLNWMRRMLDIRSRQRAFGRGTLKLLAPTNRRILAYLREYTSDKGETETILCVANVSRSAQAVELDLAVFAGRVPVEMIGGAAFPPIGQLPYLLTLPPYGFLWFVLASEAQMPPWHMDPPTPMPDFITLVLRNDVSEILNEPLRRLLEHDVLPAYLPRRRWFAAKGEKIESVRIAEAIILPEMSRPILLAEIEVRTRRVDRYLLPLGFLPEEDTVTALPYQLALTRVRRGRHVGYLTDALTLDTLPRGMIEMLHVRKVLPVKDGELRFLPTSRVDELHVDATAEIRRVSVEQSNSSVIVGDTAIVKFFRRIAAGQHPEAEMGRALSDRGFPNIAPTYGELTHVTRDGVPHVLAVIQGYLDNQGDAWSWTQNMLERAIQDAMVPSPDGNGHRLDAFAEFEKIARAIGRRLGEMHVVLAQPSDDPAFAPERATIDDCRRWAAAARARLDEVFALLKTRTQRSDEAEYELAHTVLTHRVALYSVPERLAAHGRNTLRTRTHGDLHLGQVLLVHDDAYVIDFEGEPARPLQERRAKTSPLRDVAGMLRSFDYAAATARYGSDAGETEAARKTKREIVGRFCEISERIFLAAYRDAVRPLAECWPASEAETALLQLFTLEKIAYEIAYEGANRPQWLHVPLLRLAEWAERLDTVPEAVV